jgi:hypothetical protein
VSVKTPFFPFTRRCGALVSMTLTVLVTFFVMVHFPDLTLSFLVIVICLSDLTSPEHVALDEDRVVADAGLALADVLSEKRN